jgi:hypothetical protein
VTSNDRRPILGAVVLNYRTPQDALLAVRSLQRSRRPVDDLLVVDNASQDGSVAWLEERLAGVEILASARNLGYSGGMNLGLETLRRRGATLLLALNADVVLAAEALAHLEAALDADPGAGIAGPLLLARARPGVVASRGITYDRLTGRMRHRLGSGATNAVVESVTAIDGCVMLMRRAAVEAVGGFAEEFFFGYEDLDLCLRVAARGWRTLLVPAAHAYHQGGASLAAESPQRLYYGARNQLLVARRAAPSSGRLGRAARGTLVLGWNLAHALFTAHAPRAAGLAAVLAGARDHLRGRYGPRKQ